MVASALATHQRYAEALRWLHLVFDPTRADADGATATGVVALPAVRDAGPGAGIDVLLDGASRPDGSTPQQPTRSRRRSTTRAHRRSSPHGIARMRIRAYQWMVVYKYLDVLHRLGRPAVPPRHHRVDQRGDAAVPAGGGAARPRPTRMPERPPLVAAAHVSQRSPASGTTSPTPGCRSPTRRSSRRWLAWLQWLHEHGIVGPAARHHRGAAEQLRTLRRSGRWSFCVPPQRPHRPLLGHRRGPARQDPHSQNIDGVTRRLRCSSRRSTRRCWCARSPRARHRHACSTSLRARRRRTASASPLQHATEFCGEVKALGATLLSAREKRDAEELARLRSTQELALLDADRRRASGASSTRRRRTWPPLRQSRASAESRYRHYQRLLGKEQIQTPTEHEPVAPSRRGCSSPARRPTSVDADLRGYGLTLEEADHLGWMTVGNTFTLIGGGFQVASGIAHVLPNFTFGVGSARGHVRRHQRRLGPRRDRRSSSRCSPATPASRRNRSAIVAGHQRRYDDWVLQSNLAGKEIEQIDKQLLAAEIRVDLAEREIASTTQQIENARGNRRRSCASKFTTPGALPVDGRPARRGALRGATSSPTTWPSGPSAPSPSSSASTDPGIVQLRLTGTASRRGCSPASGSSSTSSGSRPPTCERNRRELEITKHVSLSELDPIALLRAAGRPGSCEFDLPEAALRPGLPRPLLPPDRSRQRLGALRRRAVHQRRRHADAAREPHTGQRRRCPRRADEDPRFVATWCPCSRSRPAPAQNDAGLFELDFRDERYLPFEGAGAISRWRFELPPSSAPSTTPPSPTSSLHVRYTARDGGRALKEDATRRVRAALAAQRDESRRPRTTAGSCARSACATTSRPSGTA